MLPRMSAETAEPMMKSFFMVFVIGGWSAGVSVSDNPADTETLALGSKKETEAGSRGSLVDGLMIFSAHIGLATAGQKRHKAV